MEALRNFMSLPWSFDFRGIKLQRVAPTGALKMSTSRFRHRQLLISPLNISSASWMSGSSL